MVNVSKQPDSYNVIYIMYIHVRDKSTPFASRPDDKSISTVLITISNRYRCIYLYSTKRDIIKTSIGTFQIMCYNCYVRLQISKPLGQ